MKKSMIGLSILAVGLLSACQKDDVTTEKGGVEKGNTYASLTIKMANPQTRAAGDLLDNQADGPGTTGESDFNDVYLYSGLGDQHWIKNDFNDASGVFTLKDPFRVNKGEADMALSLNTRVTTGFTADALYGTLTIDNTNKDALKKDLEGVTTANKFMMTSKINHNTVQPAEKSEVENGSKNLFPFDLERVVCKGIVQMGAKLKKANEQPQDKDKKIETTDNQGTISVKEGDLMFAAVNGATRTYAFANHAANRTLSKETAAGDYNGVYTYNVPGEGQPKYESAIHASKKEMDYKKAVEEQHLVRLGYIADGNNGGQNSQLGGYAAQNVFAFLPATSDFGEDAKKYSEKVGIYFFENSWNKFESTEGFYRLAYAKIYAKYTPNEYYEYNPVKQSDGNYKFQLKLVQTKDKALENGTFFRYKNTMYSSKTAAIIAMANDGVAGVSALLGVLEGDYKDATEEEPYEANTNDDIVKFFKDKADKPEYAIYTYANGKCGYYSLWNAQGSAKDKIAYGDTRRNNVYVLTINDFMQVGFPWDPSDPNDPNLPKHPGDPDPGINNPDVNTTYTYMAVKAQVLPWNVVERGVELHN